MAGRKVYFCAWRQGCARVKTFMTQVANEPAITAEVDIALPDDIARHLESMEQQIQSLQAELTMLRGRDEMLKAYMDRLDEELRLASKLQRDFLPKALPEIGRVRFHTLFRPAGYVSGDLYDVTRLDEKHVGFFIADAVGHGMPAALITMFVKRALQTKEITRHGYRLLSPGEALGRLNDALIDQNLSQATFATALYGIINVNTLAVSFARAGHPNPILLTKHGEAQILEADGGLLGIFPHDSYTNGHTLIRPGDRLFLFTDGVDVAFSQSPGEFDWKQELLARKSMSTK